MKNIKKKLCLIVAACLCFVGLANAGGSKEKAENSLLCSLVPTLCVVTIRGGNGGGDVPPPPPPQTTK